jgi:cell wall-associated NlpC family hydrolase
MSLRAALALSSPKRDVGRKDKMRGFSRLLFLGLLPLVFSVPSFSQLQQTNTFVYVNNDITPLFFGPNSVSAFKVGSDGSITELTAQKLGAQQGSPFPTGGTGGGGGTALTNRIAVAGTFLYVSNGGSNDITVFAIDPKTGVLTRAVDPGTGAQLPPMPTGFSGSFGIALAATPDHGYLYAASEVSVAGGAINCSSCNSILAFQIGSNGSLSPIQSQPLPGGSDYLKVSPDGRFLAATGSGTSVTVFNIGLGGLLSSAQTVFVGVVVNSVDFNCGSNLLFAPIQTASSVAVLQVSPNGSLSQIAGSPFSFNSNNGSALATLLTPNDLHLFVTTYSKSGNNSSSIASLNVTPGSGGALAQTGTSGPLTGLPVGAATDQRGAFLYATTTGGSVTGYKIEPETCFGSTCSVTAGSLTQVGTQVQLPPGTGAPSVAVFPPKTCFGNLAAQQAQTDVSGLYGYGGKGFDYAKKPDTSGVVGYAGYATPSIINDSGFGYLYYASNGPDSSLARVADLYNPAYPSQVETSDLLKQPPVLIADYGMDCSGLVFWSYNSAVEATRQQLPGEPSPSLELPLWYDNAGPQCSTSQSTFLVNDVLDPSTGLPKAGYHHPLDLRPGDLLCFTYRSNNTPIGGHVAIYLGNQAIQAGQDAIEDYIRSTKVPPAQDNGVVIASVDARPFKDAANLTNCSAPSSSNPCFTFDGFWRPKEPQVAILWQAHSPVSLEVTDPDGNTISATTWVQTEHEAYRGAGDLAYNDYSSTGDDMVFSPRLKTGVYSAKVVPKPGAAPTDTYSLTVTAAGTTMTLALNVPISNIPSQGYAVMSTGSAISIVQTDTIPPTTTATVSPQPNAAGWSNSNVTVSLSSVDNPGGAGISQITYSVAGAQSIPTMPLSGSSTSFTISTEGISTITFYGTDNAGNVEAANTLVIRLDKTPPTVTGTRTPAANANGWNNSSVTVSFQCADTLSGLAAGSPPAPSVLSTQGAGQSVSGTCTDIAGNAASASIQGINIDLNPPILTIRANPPANANGWNNTDVTVSFAAVDTLSGVAVVSAPITMTSEGGQIVNGSATDMAGNSATGSVTISIDKTPPEVFTQFDPQTKDIVLFGRDSLSGVTPDPVLPVSLVPLGQGDNDGDDMGCLDSDDMHKELRTYQVLDLAGNPVTLVEKVKRKGRLLRAKFISIQYGNGPVTTLPRNRESFDWTLAKDGTLRELDQEFRIAPNWDVSRVEADFDAATNQTIVIQQVPKPKSKVVKPGLDLLHLATSGGALSIEF